MSIWDEEKPFSRICEQKPSRRVRWPLYSRLPARASTCASGAMHLVSRLGGDAAALRVILTDKAQAAAVRQVGVERDAGNAVVGQLADLRFYGNVVEGAERDALCAPVDQLVEQGDGLAGNIGFTGAHTDFRVAAGQLDAGAFDAARDLLAERACPVGQKHGPASRASNSAAGLRFDGAPRAEKGIRFRG